MSTLPTCHRYLSYAISDIRNPESGVVDDNYLVLLATTMLAGATPFGRVVDLDGTTLADAAGDDGGVHIHSDALEANLIKNSALLSAHYAFIGALHAAKKLGDDSFEVRHALDAKHAFQDRVVANDFAVRKAVGPG